LEEIMVVKHPRSTSVVRLGSISFGRSNKVCTIRSISAFGAALDVAADEKIPDEFVLTVIPDGGPRRCCVLLIRYQLIGWPVATMLRSPPNERRTQTPKAALSREGLSRRAPCLMSENVHQGWSGMATNLAKLRAQSKSGSG
jgi:hypothetical protein